MSSVETYPPTALFLAGASGVRLAADRRGPDDGPVILLLHGGGQTRHSWRRSAAALAAEGFRVYSLDTRGHGDSDWSPDRNYDVHTLAADVRAVIDQLAVPVVLVGASLGGLTSLLVARDAGPSVVTGLVLVDVVPRFEASGGDRVRSFMAERPDGFASLDEAAESVSRYLPHRPRPASAEGLRRNLRRRPDGRWHWHWDPGFLAGIDHADSIPPEFIDELEEAAIGLQIPILLLRGKLSDVVSVEGVQRFIALVPGTRFIEISGAGHTAAGDDNDAFTEAIHDYITERTRSQTSG
jgi:pimeloyl-ACP methyl ester carboxylesterase